MACNYEVENGYVEPRALLSSMMQFYANVVIIVDGYPYFQNRGLDQKPKESCYTSNL